MTIRTATLYVRRTFSAAHFLPHYDGPCKNLHGHTWKVEVWLRGPVGENGMVVDFGKVKSAIDELDHICLNDVVPNPTAENLAIYLLDQIPLCFKLRLWESEDCYVEVTG